jgi:hypothetical protein
MSFRDLKRNATKNFQKLNDQLNKLASNKFHDPLEDKLWKVTRDKAGNGSAIIRFLPAPEGEDQEFIRIWDHGFKGPGGWYIEKSLTTLNEDDPVSEYNSKLWNSGFESDKKIASNQKRRLSFYSNIYVIKDPKNPENEGKVFIFKYGKKIFDRLNDLMNPSFEDETPINPFDLWGGANFKLKVRDVDGWPNYDKSEFEDAGPLFDDDDKLEEVYNSMYSLQELLDRKNFKTYDELKTRLDKALGINTSDSKDTYKEAEESLPWNEDDEKTTSSSASLKEAKEPDFGSSSDDVDLDMDFFNNLADEN